MTGDDFQTILSDHVAWCRKEHAAALRQVEFFAAGGAKALVRNGNREPDDITEAVIRHGREVLEQTQALIAAFERHHGEG
jgi:hypothetical protein